MKQVEWKLYQGNAETVLKDFQDEFFDCCITSPPYYALRDYGTGKWVGGDENCDHVANNNATKRQGNEQFNENRPSREETICKGYYRSVCPKCGAVMVDEQIGLEETPEQYIDRLVRVFREVRRVLKNDGTLWVNIGDSYAGSGKGSGGDGVPTGKQATNKGSNFLGREKPPFKYNCKQKDLIGIPWMLAFALRNDGWYLRQDIIWAKPNPMPESVTDRCTKSHEYIFLLSKSQKYYFDYDAIKVNSNPIYADRYKYDFHTGEKENGADRPNNKTNTAGKKEYTGKANKKSVWNVPTSGGYKDESGAHHATFPIALIEPCVLAGSRDGGYVLDIFNGSGTTGVCALQNGRNYVGIDLSNKYIDISTNRLRGITDQLRLF